MAATTIDQQVRSVVHEVLRVAPEKITPESRIKEDLGADSLDVVSLIMALEEEFKGSISDDEAKGLTTVGSVVELIASRAAAEGS